MDETRDNSIGASRWFCRGECNRSLSHRAPVGSATAGDASNLIAKKVLVCLPANIGPLPECIAGD